MKREQKLFKFKTFGIFCEKLTKTEREREGERERGRERERVIGGKKKKSFKKLFTGNIYSTSMVDKKIEKVFN